MIKLQAEQIKTKIEYINKHYAPIKLNFKMFQSERPYDVDGNWAVSIVYNYTENDFMALFGMCYSYAEVKDLGIFYSDETGVQLFKCKKCGYTERQGNVCGI